MTNLEKLQALGAEIVTGDLIWKHKHLGYLRNGELFLTDEGTKALDIVDVEVKEVVEPAAPKSLRGRKKAAEVVEAAEPVVDAEPAAE